MEKKHGQALSLEKFKMLIDRVSITPVDYHYARKYYDLLEKPRDIDLLKDTIK